MNKRDLKSLSNEALLSQLSKLVKQSRRIESVLVAHIAEVDVRRLYAREAMPSMHQFCTGVLGLSDAEAYLRIEAARTSRRYPMVLTMLEDGRLHLSGIGVLAPLLKTLDRGGGEALLERAVRKSKRELKGLVAELEPRPDVPPSIRKAPERQPKTAQPAPKTELPERFIKTQTSCEEITTSGRSDPEPAKKPAAEPRDHREKVEPLARARYIVQFTASGELRDKLDRLKGLMPGQDLASLIEAAVTEKLERLEAKRFGKTTKPRKTLDEADTSPGVRGISAPVKRFVWERDGGRCTFVSQDGRRCPERHDLEFHHVKPFGLGGDRSASNVVLMCKQHNLYLAELDYGKERMDRYRRAHHVAREPSPRYGLDCVRSYMLIESATHGDSLRARSFYAASVRKQARSI
jgi:hypothetical protein